MNALWFKDAVLYEVHVRAFQDGNQDGIGDFVGLTQRLDYLADLGITALWLLPFTSSPLKDDGYDIADYTSVHPNYGTLDDFRTFLDKAHSLGIRVITELVINHTSDQHPWFQRARRAAVGSSERNFYVWSDTTDRYAGVPLMFPDFETSNWAWDPIAKQYYWHRFYSHQPDLNFDNPDVWKALWPVVDFWFEMGVDGMRLDAVPYLFEREGTSCEHLPETHNFLKELRSHVESRFPDRMFLAEANAWPEDMVRYFGNGDECQMAFHFPLMPRLFMALHQEDRFPIVDILAQTPAIPDNCQWCLFLRNHDELTLAMVTDQERDEMWTEFARDRQARLFLGIRHRLAPLLRNDRRRIELLNAILFSLPGSPVIYYGDEIGMGDNIYLGDRNGVRTPMQWSDDRNAGFSRANSQRLYLPVIATSEYHYEACNVEAQQNNHSSLLWWMKRLIAMRKRHAAFGRGEFRMLEPANSHVLAYVRQTESECLLIVVNLSRFVQNVQFDLSPFSGLVPEEMFGGSRFPAIQSDQSYGLTLGPHSFYWFELVPETAGNLAAADLPLLEMEDWASAPRSREWDRIAALLLARYTSDSPSRIIECRLIDHRQVPVEDVKLELFVSQLEYLKGPSEMIFELLALVPQQRFEGADALPAAIGLARLGPPDNLVLCDPAKLPEYKAALFKAFQQHDSVTIPGGERLSFRSWKDFSPSADQDNDNSEDRQFVDRSTRSMTVLNPQYVLRWLRRADEGLNPDVEVGQFLKSQSFEGFADIVGTLEYRRHSADSMTVAALHKMVENQGDAWHLVLERSSHFYEIMAAHPSAVPENLDSTSTTDPAGQAPAEDWKLWVGPFFEIVKSLATFTARLHLTLASASPGSALAPVPMHQRSFYQTLRNSAGRMHARLGQLSRSYSATVFQSAMRVKALYPKILDFIQSALNPDFGTVQRIRCHGNYHLDKLLVTGREFVLSDFEGRRDVTIGDRQVKRPSVSDVATLLSSFHYAMHAVRLGLIDEPNAKVGHVREEDRERLGQQATIWLNHLEQRFYETYIAELGPSKMLPQAAATRHDLLKLCLLAEAIRNIEQDLVQRPDWAVIPLNLLLSLIDKEQSQVDAD